MDSKYHAAIGLAVAAVAVVIAFLFIPSPSEPALEPAAPPPATAVAPSQPVGLPEAGDFAPAPAVPGSITPGTAAVAEEAWVEQLDALLTSEEETGVTARKLVAAMPGLPPEAQEEFAAHAANLCDDEDFGMLENIFLVPGTSPEVLDVIFNDALNRSDEIKLPMLARTLRNPAHPMAAEAREILEMYLDLEPGSAPVGRTWESAVADYLREEAAAQP